MLYMCLEILVEYQAKLVLDLVALLLTSGACGHLFILLTKCSSRRAFRVLACVCHCLLIV